MIDASQLNLQLLSWLETHWWVLPIASVWSLVWKGMALWKSAQRDERNWFIALLVINTLGIFEIVYLYYFSSDEVVIEKIEG